MERNKPKEFSYSVNEEPIVLSKPLLDILLKQENSSDLIALYCFYYYTAKWQKTDQPRANSSYVMSGLKWGEVRFTKTKRKLRELGLIEDITVKGSDSKIEGHYIRLNFLWVEPLVVTPLGRHPGDNPGTNALKTNNKSIFSEKHEKNIIPPSIRMVTLYCRERNNSVNPRTFIDFYSSKGWLIGKAKMKDWQAAVRTWESHDQSPPSNKPDIYDDGIHYVWDGKIKQYVHNKTRQIYIP